MSMKSAQLGKRTSDVEVVSISSNGLWVLVDKREYFLGFAQFPWFKRAAVSAVLNVQRPGAGHLHWPELDVDLAIESIENPKRFPLVSRLRPNQALQRTAGARARLRSAKSTSARRR
jgi:hypothetical protein